VKNADTAGTKGYDTGKKVSGIKRHIAVDTLGLPHAIAITPADAVKRNEVFAALPKRWIVERSFAWLEKCRRLWKNCERLRTYS
jgi:transposase